MGIRTTALLGATALALGACSSGGGAGALAGGAGSGWNKDDACKTLDKADVAAATGQPVTAAENMTTAASIATVATCTYTLASGTVVLMTRISESDLDDAEIEGMRAIVNGVELPGYGMKAFWTDENHQLQLFADRRHYANIVYGPELRLRGTPAPAGPDPKVIVTSLAKKLL